MSVPALGKGHARASPATVWAVLGVVYFLFKGLKRLVPYALQPFTDGMGTASWVAYVLTAVFFAYCEGYRGFQQRFSPLVVRRAFLLNNQQPPLRQVLAPAYAMALFGATEKRKRIEWGIVFAIICLVVVVKRLPYPYRSILDVGVCVGLSWGICSVLAIFAKSLRTGHAPDVDPCLPEEP